MTDRTRQEHIWKDYSKRCWYKPIWF